MRQETQHWDSIRALLEVVLAGAGVTGLTVTATVLRLSDSQWWREGGVGWTGAPFPNAVAEKDAVNLPGLYELAITPGDLTYSDGFPGYVVLLEEATTPVTEYLFITPLRRSSQDDVVSDHDTAGTFGELLTVTKSLAQGNQRIKNTTYDADGRMLSADIVTFANGADAAADVNAIATFGVTAVYDVDGNMTSLLSSE
jgi:hypothetical protein